MSFEPIICFIHCDKNVKILCLGVPECCPDCGKDMNRYPMKIPPFRLPSPFTHSRENPFSIILMPTVGTFLNDYTKTSNIHVGVVDSKGVVYHFDEKGVNRSSDGWSECAAIQMLNPRITSKWTSLWNIKLQEYTAYDKWRPERYSPVTNNCYDFALGFLRLLGLEELYACVDNRSEFCRTMVNPLMMQVSKYVTMYRQLQEQRCIVHCNTAL